MMMICRRQQQQQQNSFEAVIDAVDQEGVKKIVCVVAAVVASSC